MELGQQQKKREEYLDFLIFQMFGQARRVGAHVHRQCHRRHYYNYAVKNNIEKRTITTKLSALL
eukprot:7800791-Ditylum_brightwellii.AAC.1